MSGIATNITDPSPEPSPVSAAKLGVWFYIASEIMLFAGLIGAFLVLRASDPQIFSNQQSTGHRLIAVLMAGALLGATGSLSFAAKRNRHGQLIVALLCGAVFCGATFFLIDWQRQTILSVAADKIDIDVYDGVCTSESPTTLTVNGVHARADWTFDLHRTTSAQLAKMGPDATAGVFTVDRSSITKSIHYGPWKNNYFASFDLLVGMVAIHVIVGMIILAVLLLQPVVTVNAVDTLRLYWAFYAVVWIVLLPMLFWS